MSKKGMSRFTAFCLAAGLMVSQGGMLVMADVNDDVLVGISNTSKVSAEAEDYLKSLNAPEEAEASEEADTAEEAEEAAAEAEETETETEAPKEIDRSMVGTTGFAQVDEYLNVRASGDSEGEVVGKVYNNGSLEILDVDENGWYYVRSGNVTGYVSSLYVATGDEAENIAADHGYTTAKVGAEALNVRADATVESDIVGLIENADQVEVVEEGDEWVKVVLDNGTYGYVSADFVETRTEYATGETLEEEQERLDEQWLAYLAEQEAAYEAYLASQPVYTETYTEPTYTETYTAPTYTAEDFYSYTEEQAAADAAAADAAYAAEVEAQAAYEAQAQADASAQNTVDAQSNAEAMYQAYLDAQAAADSAVANGEGEESINSTASSAQAAYEAYLNAQAAADAAAQAEADAAWAAEQAAAVQAEADAAAAAAQAEADAAAAQAQADAEAAAAQAQAEADAQAQEYVETYEDVESYEETYEEVYEETYEETYEEPQVSSTGQSIANYATQFVGNPYVWGGESLTNGADCSGFVKSVFANYGISLPHSAEAQSGYGSSVSMDNLQPGDLLFYSNGGGIGHVSIYIGGGQVVHASSSTTGIIISSVGYRTPVCAKRLV